MSALTITRPTAPKAREEDDSVSRIVEMLGATDQYTVDDTPRRSAGVRLWLLGVHVRLTVLAAHGFTSAAESLQKHALRMRDRHLELTIEDARAQLTAAPTPAMIEPIDTEPIAVAATPARRATFRAVTPDADQATDEAVSFNRDALAQTVEVTPLNADVPDYQTVDLQQIRQNLVDTAPADLLREETAPVPARKPARIRNFDDLAELGDQSVIVLWVDRGWNVDMDVYVRDFTGWIRWIADTDTDVPHSDMSIWNIATGSNPRNITRVFGADQPTVTLQAEHLAHYAHQSLIVGLRDGIMTSVFRKVGEQWVDLTPRSGELIGYDGVDLHRWYTEAGGTLIHGWQPTRKAQPTDR
ncbi:hypothetical protein [Agromyces humi]|uniref:hypothetical protein n=1 Tax=Agromyces humi TaxID=1766800 RepID=UPI001359244C|nr:hypothetical protein [Agromyces humi]